MGAFDKVTLRTGKVTPESTVAIVWIVLNKVLETDSNAFQQLAVLARNPQHKLNGSTVDVLKNFDLLKKDGKLTDVVRDVVLAATSGEEPDFILVDPVTPQH